MSYVSFQPELIKEYQHVIYQNIIKGMKVLVDARDKLNIPWENPKNYDIGFHVLKFENTMVLDTRLFLHYVPALQSLWKDASIRRAFDRRREFQLVSFLLVSSTLRTRASFTYLHFIYARVCGMSYIVILILKHSSIYM